MTDNKYSRFAFTAYEAQWPLVQELSQDALFVKMCKWQQEVCPTSGRKHWQGALLTHRPVRFKTVMARLKGVHIEPAKDWNALLAYCCKEETRDPSGNPVEIRHDRLKTVDELLILLAETVWELWELSLGDKETFLIRSTHPPTHPDFDGMDRKLRLDQYWQAVAHLCRIPAHRSRIGFYSQPIPQNAWIRTAHIWLGYARIARETMGLPTGEEEEAGQGN